MLSRTSLERFLNKTDSNSVSKDGKIEVFSTEDLLLIKVLRQEKGYDNNDIASFEITVSPCCHGNLCFGRVIENM